MVILYNKQNFYYEILNIFKKKNTDQDDAFSYGKIKKTISLRGLRDRYMEG
jgi:hypothetical protein